MAFVEQEKRRQIVVAARKVREANIHTVFDAYASRQYTTARLDDHGFRRATTKLGIELSAKERKELVERITQKTNWMVPKRFSVTTERQSVTPTISGKVGDNESGNNDCINYFEFRKIITQYVHC